MERDKSAAKELIECLKINRRKNKMVKIKIKEEYYAIAIYDDDQLFFFERGTENDISPSWGALSIKSLYENEEEAVKVIDGWPENMNGTGCFIMPIHTTLRMAVRSVHVKCAGCGVTMVYNDYVCSDVEGETFCPTCFESIFGND